MTVSEEARQAPENTRATLDLIYHVSRELASSLDLRTVLQRVLFLSLKTVVGNSGSIIVMDDEGLPIESAIIYGGKVYDQTTESLRATLDEGLAGWVVRNREAVLIKDTSRDERWLRRPDDSLEHTGPKSSVSAPLLARERLVGVMTLSHPEPGFFNEENFSLIKAIADQAGIAVLNARLYEESQKQARVMAALAESAATINVSLRQEEVLDRILKQISGALDVAAVSLALIDPRTNELEFTAASGESSDSIIGVRLNMGQGIAGWVAQEGRSVIVPKASEDPRFFSNVDQRTGFSTQSIACVPIRAQGEVIGVIEAMNPLSGEFKQESLFLLSGIGSLAGTAISHAQLFERVEIAHQRFLELFEDSIDPILITDWDGKINEANRRAVLSTGFTKEDLQGMNIGHLHKIDWDKVGQKFDMLPSTGTLSYESALNTQEQEQIPIEVYVRRVTIDGHNRLQWILRDLTERKNLEAMREDLLSMIYHDLRSPLSNVVSSLDILASMVPMEEFPSIKPVLDIALRSTERVQRLTKSLLDTRRLEMGQSIGEQKPVTPASLMNEALQAVAPVVEGKNQEIVSELLDTLPPVNVDEEMIRRVLINILENAVKYTPQNEIITVGARRDGDFVAFWVQDRGRGIPTEDQDFIFEKFTRSRTGASGGTKGLGLGLAFCRLAVQGHGGRIKVESKPGAGSRFTFTVPVVQVS